MQLKLRFEPILFSDWSFVDRLDAETFTVYEMVMNLNIPSNHFVIDKSEFPSRKQIETALIELSNLGLVDVS